MADEEKEFLGRPSEADRVGRKYVADFHDATGFAGMPKISVQCYICGTKMDDEKFINIARHITRCEAARDGTTSRKKTSKSSGSNRLKESSRNNVEPNIKQTNFICCLCRKRKKSREDTPHPSPDKSLGRFVININKQKKRSPSR